ncbi:MAG: hypothetical protein GTN78_06725, partial [Gemmatimonadales bacterium]|nr:hypothetical protein [Gemmatimonadales bacterium]
NTSGSTIDDIAFYQYYFPSPYGMYPVNDPDMISHADYVSGVSDPMGYDYDITLYGQDGWVWAYAGLSTSIPPSEYTVGHTGGYPDPPYYSPGGGRPSAIVTDVLRQVENDALAGQT